MIQRTYPTVRDAYMGMTDEISHTLDAPVIKWGVCLGYKEPVCVTIEDASVDTGLHLGEASFTKARWTRFLKRYFRADLQQWVDDAYKKLARYSSRPFVASYSMNINVDDQEARSGHNYGGCLSSLQMRLAPRPEVILYSRACQIDKIGYLDLSLIHIIARQIKEKRNCKVVPATWVISLGFISAISQIFYAMQFDRPYEGNRLKKSMDRIMETADEDLKFGPLIRGRARMKSLGELGYIPGDVWVKDLTIDPKLFKFSSKTIRKMKAKETAAAERAAAEEAQEEEPEEIEATAEEEEVIPNEELEPVEGDFFELA
jgi:hypothetical protein